MKAELKIRTAIQYMGSFEVSWFGVIVKQKDGNFRLIDIMFPPQENKSTFVTTKDDEFPQWYYETFIKNGNPSMIRLHGHTHPTFGVTPSGTDIQQFKEILAEVDDYYIQFIVNNKLETTCILHTHKDKEKLEVVWEYYNKMEDILKKVTTKKTILSETYPFSYHSRIELFPETRIDTDEDQIYEIDTGGYDPYEP